MYVEKGARCKGLIGQDCCYSAWEGAYGFDQWTFIARIRLMKLVTLPVQFSGLLELYSEVALMLRGSPTISLLFCLIR
jgi:hypothetical protein